MGARAVKKKADHWKRCWALVDGRAGKARKRKNAVRRTRLKLERHKSGRFSEWVMRVNIALWTEVYCPPLLAILKAIYTTKDIETLIFTSPFVGMLPRHRR